MHSINCSLCVYVVWNTFTVFGGWIYRAVLATPYDGESSVSVHCYTCAHCCVLKPFLQSALGSRSLRLGVVGIVEQPVIVQFAVRYTWRYVRCAGCNFAREISNLIYVAQSQLVATLRRILNCCSVTRRGNWNRAVPELNSKCIARLSLHTYFGIRQPLIASFAEPRKGKYPVVDA